MKIIHTEVDRNSDEISRLVAQAHREKSMQTLDVTSKNIFVQVSIFHSSCIKMHLFLSILVLRQSRKIVFMRLCRMYKRTPSLCVSFSLAACRNCSSTCGSAVQKIHLCGSAQNKNR